MQPRAQPQTGSDRAMGHARGTICRRAAPNRCESEDGSVGAGSVDFDGKDNPHAFREGRSQSGGGKIAIAN